MGLHPFMCPGSQGVSTAIADMAQGWARCKTRGRGDRRSRFQVLGSNSSISAVAATKDNGATAQVMLWQNRSVQRPHPPGLGWAVLLPRFITANEIYQGWRKDHLLPTFSLPSAEKANFGNCKGFPGVRHSCIDEMSPIPSLLINFRGSGEKTLAHFRK